MSPRVMMASCNYYGIVIPVLWSMPLRLVFDESFGGTVQ